MKMTKTMKAFGLMAIAAFAFAGFTACDDDESNDSLLGEWVSIDTQEVAFIDKGLVHCRFFEDGVAYFNNSIHGLSYVQVRPGYGITDTNSFRQYEWGTNGSNSIYLKTNYDPINYQYSIKNGVLTLGENKFIRPKKSPYSWSPRFLCEIVANNTTYSASTSLSPSTEATLVMWDAIKGKNYQIDTAFLYRREFVNNVLVTSDSINVTSRFKDGTFKYNLKTLDQDNSDYHYYIEVVGRVTGKIADNETNDTDKTFSLLNSFQIYCNTPK